MHITQEGSTTKTKLLGQTTDNLGQLYIHHNRHFDKIDRLPDDWPSIQWAF